MTICATTFAAAMEEHWVHSLKNTSSAELKKVWLQIGQAFADAIEAQGTPQEDIWRVLQPPTGTGKTQSVAVYSTMLATAAPKVGVLVVVRLIKQADELAAQVNRLAGQIVAVAKHSESAGQIPLDPSDAQVLVVTHAALRLALRNSIIPGRSDNLDRLLHWKHGLRSLRIIDEAIDVIDHGQLRLDDLGYLIGAILQYLREEHAEAVRCLEELKRVFKVIHDAVKQGRRPPSGFVFTDNTGHLQDLSDLAPVSPDSQAVAV